MLPWQLPVSKYSFLQDLIELDCDVDLSLKLIVSQRCTHVIIFNNREMEQILRLSDA